MEERVRSTASTGVMYAPGDLLVSNVNVQTRPTRQVMRSSTTLQVGQVGCSVWAAWASGAEGKRYRYNRRCTSLTGAGGRNDDCELLARLRPCHESHQHLPHSSQNPPSIAFFMHMHMY